MRKKVVLKEPDISETPVEQPEPVDKDLDYFRTLYPEGDEKLVCRLYKSSKNEFGNIKRTFLDEFSQVPTEKEIAEKFGGGDFELFLMKREGVKGGLQLQAKAKFAIDKVWTKPQTEQKVSENNDKQSGNIGIKDKLEELKMMKDVMFSGSNPSGNNEIMQMMFQMQTTLLTMILEMSKSNGKSDNKLLESILPTLLNKSLEKQNVLSDIETVAKIKEIFPSGDGGGGTDWGSVISSTLPILLSMSNSGRNNSVPQLQQSSKPVIQIDKRILKEAVKESLEEMENEYVDEETEDPEAKEVKLSTERKSNIINLTESENESIEDSEMNIKSQIKLIKNSPKAAQDQVLKMWCSIKPVQEVMQFCIDTELVKDKEEFIKRLEDLQIDTQSLAV